MLQKSSARACQARFHGAQMDAEHCGNVLIAQVFDLPEQQNFPVLGRKPGQGPFQGVQALRGLQGGLRGGAGILNARCLLFFQRHEFDAPGSAQLIKGQVAGDLEQPGGKARQRPNAW